MHRKTSIPAWCVAVGLVSMGLLSPIAQAQKNPSTQPQAPTVQQVEATACGDFHVNFEAMQDGTHSLAPAVPGKALVYVISDFYSARGKYRGGPTVRIGMDGRWAGANRGGSYTSFYVSPGKHHLCVNWQSRFHRLNKLVVLKDLNAQPGEIYYFRIQYVVVDVGYDDSYDGLLNLDAVDPSEGQFLVAQYPHVTSKINVISQTKK